MSSVSNEYLQQTKKNLIDALSDNKTKYFSQMKQWFRGRMTKELFDSNARELLTLSTVHLHNEFLLAILTKCQLFSTTPPPPNLATTFCANTSASNTNTINISTGTSTSTSSHILITTSIPTSTTSAHVTSSSGQNSESSAAYNNLRGNSSSNSIFSPTSNAIANGAINSRNSSTTGDIFSSADTINNSIPSVGSLNTSSTNASFANTNSSSNMNMFMTTGTDANKTINTTNSSSNNIFSNNSNNINGSSSNSVFVNVSSSNNNSAIGSSNSVNSYSNISNNNLGTNTNAITINNTSGNISIKVELPMMHNIDSSNIMAGGGGGGPGGAGGNSGGGGMVVNSGGIVNIAGADKKKVRPPKKKIKNSKHGSEPVFSPTPLLSIAPTASLREPHVLRESRAGHHVRTHALLGLGELRGRLLLAAWDHGLNAATEGVVRLLHHASKQVVENVLSCAVRSRAGFRMREGRFMHSLGTTPPNPWLRGAANAQDWTNDSLGLPVSGGSDSSSVGDRPLLWPTAEAANQNAAHLMSFCPPTPPPLPPLTCLDLYTALKNCPSVLPCHTVYSLSMERLSASLSHADHNTLAQEALNKQEQQHRAALRQYRILPTL